MQHDPYVWTWYSSGKLLIVRKSELDKSEHEVLRGEPKLLAPWADALARNALQVDLLNCAAAGEA